MKLTNPGFSRVLHERSDYHHDRYRVQKEWRGTRENPSRMKQEGGEPLHIPQTDRWIANKKSNKKDGNDE